MVQSNKYYKFRTVGVASEVGFTTDRDLSELLVLKKHDVFYSSEIPEVRLYNPHYNRIISHLYGRHLKLIDLFIKLSSHISSTENDSKGMDCYGYVIGLMIISKRRNESGFFLIFSLHRFRN